MVSLVKSAEQIAYAEVRTPEHGAAYDLFDWAKRIAPLWWDDASYARYQADDGPQGAVVYELSFIGNERAPIVGRFVSYFDAWGEYVGMSVADGRSQRTAAYRAVLAADEARRVRQEDQCPF